MAYIIAPGNEAFRIIRNSGYVDKSGLISVMNSLLDTDRNLVCVSRPRRFGKSYAAKMLCAYYDASESSDELFDDLKIATTDSYHTYMNQYNVIYLDMSSAYSGRDEVDPVAFIYDNITSEVKELFPEVKIEKELFNTLSNVVKKCGKKFFFIIDEWDTPIREGNEHHALQYLKLLRSLFKNGVVTQNIFSGVYMTGILPIKKDGSQSSLSDFKEYTMVRPGRFTSCIGFTEDEVEQLCVAHGSDFKEMKRWYDGYRFPDGTSIYNPNSVMNALEDHCFTSYWTESSASNNLMKYIEMDFDGLEKSVADIMAGNDVPVDILGFSNDLITFRNKDDILTLLIHLGYLTYDANEKVVRIPNEEIRIEFERSLRNSRKSQTIRRIQESNQLILDTVHMNEEAVASQIEKVHSEETTPLFYNNEQALRSVVKLAYFSYRDYYAQMEELPSGLGYADIVYIPKKTVQFPALLIELKWNHTAESAVKQIKERKYPEVLKQFDGEILLVSISYNKDSKEKKHSVKIEKYCV